ncbi:hypothetical protein K1719_014437 [Acacia pycnantha]|nr:hypothetical protein K1719_014437 [Acacia pycnantha]
MEACDSNRSETPNVSLSLSLSHPLYLLAFSPRKHQVPSNLSLTLSLHQTIPLSSNYRRLFFNSGDSIIGE